MRGEAKSLQKNYSLINTEFKNYKKYRKEYDFNNKTNHILLIDFKCINIIGIKFPTLKEIQIHSKYPIQQQI